jgi:PAS domain S-box-containing protein
MAMLDHQLIKGKPMPEQSRGKINPKTVRFLIIFAGVFLAGAVAFTLPRLGGRLAVPLLPSGIALALLYRWGRGLWPAVFLAGLAIDLCFGQPILASIGVGIGLAAGTWLAVRLLERGGFDESFSRAKDVPLFLLAVAVGMTLPPAFGLLGFFFSGSTSFATHPINWVRWWNNAASGAFLVGPPLMAYNRRSLDRFREHWTEGALWLLGVLVLCGAILVATADTVRPLVMVASLFLVVISAVRFGLVPAAGASFAVSTVAAASVIFGIGLFGRYDPLGGLVLIWSFVGGLAGVSLIITALLGERDTASLEVLRAEQRYQQIFNGSPQPLWVHAPDSLGFLLVNDAAVRQYGWTRDELMARTVDVLAGSAKTVLPPLRDTGATFDLAPEPFETQHVTKDGRVLEVEVWTQSIDCGGLPGELVFAIDVTERRAFGQALMDAIGGEQRRIAQEMHDGLGQELTGLALSVRALANRAQKERDAISVDLDQLALLATSCIQDAHRIVQGLSPLTNSDGNLDAALEALAQRSSLSGTRVRFRSRHETPPNVELKMRNHLYRIAQEAVQNALKHSGAKSIEIELAARAGDLRLSVVDDGQGLITATANSGLGMRTMRFRASAIGGKLSVTRGADGGNSVVCEVPTKQIFAATA